MKLVGPATFLKLSREALKGWDADNCMSMGAALAFYSMLSMAPLLVMVITIVGIFLGRDGAQALLFSQLSGLLGETGAEGIKAVLNAANSDKAGALQTAISAVVLLIGATTVFGELQDDLNRIWKCESPEVSGLWGHVRKRLLSFGLVLVIGFLLLVSLVISAAVSYMARACGGMSLAGNRSPKNSPFRDPADSAITCPVQSSANRYTRTLSKPVNSCTVRAVCAIRPTTSVEP